MSRMKPKCVGLAVIGIACALLLSACASPRSYMGIDFDSSAVDGSIIALARKAQSGDKHAQLELGIGFEEGRGITRDLKRARALYRMAASDGGRRVWVYLPSSGVGVAGRPIALDRGPLQPGIPEAKDRLTAIQKSKGEK